MYALKMKKKSYLHVFFTVGQNWQRYIGHNLQSGSSKQKAKDEKKEKKGFGINT